MGQPWEWGPWCRGVAALRRGQAGEALAVLEPVRDPLKKWSALALALHRLGRADDARAALREADAAADARARAALAADDLRVPDQWWADWLLYRALRREAHQAIRGTPPPDSPYRW